ncbi:uncharacterized protein LOC9637548 [Selaginella moellendorffii]|uniref:uncharacterized protein LOC9637548 n=1 Tax=Selaginella moellendorffii TaxID=88036 RepID=UPI000D1C39AE|nr:uncharacterized protein LOC9637548 [Selaginella moellendorffii]|eukprot:XP_024517946.1 uncharacterized protein LOC9637548 [Selaginella moellendorffii]
MEPSSCCGFLPVPPEVVIGRFNPFSEAQQVQLRAQIIVYGSIVRELAPEETLMSLCFADISTGSSVEDFHEGNLGRSAWEKIWQAASFNSARAKKPSKSKAASAAPSPAPPAKTKAPKPAIKRKASKAATANSSRKKSVKQKNISDLDSDVVVVQQVITDATETQSNSEEEEEEKQGGEEADTELEQLAASAIKAMSDLPPTAGKKKGGRQEEEGTEEGEDEEEEEEEEAHCKASEDNTSRDPGDLTDEKAESMEIDDAETSKISNVEEGLRRHWKEIVQGAMVEVISDEDGLHGVWFSGKVRTVRKDKVQVVYTDLLHEDGQTMLQEWVSSCDLMNDAPKIRLAHPVTSADLPLKRNNFSVGDHVDAWMNDGWWEGIVEGINSENQKQVTLFFPGEGDIGVAKISHLRPSLVWKNGEWILWAPKEGGKKVRKQPVSKPSQVIPEKKFVEVTPVVLDGKRKRERPKRLADGLDDEQPPRKPYTRRAPPASRGSEANPTKRVLPPRNKASSSRAKRK